MAAVALSCGCRYSRKTDRPMQLAVPGRRPGPVNAGPGGEGSGAIEAKPPQSAQMSALIPIGLATYMASPDRKINSSVLPVIAQAFHSDVASVEWIITVYLLVQS